MHKTKQILRSEILVECLIVILISGLAYLLFVPRFGYFYDDWYLMYAAGAKGPAVFWDIFGVDRPLRALVMIPAYTLFGANPLYYNLGAFLFRLIGGFSFLWILRRIWPGNNRVTLWMSLLFLLYPGFLSQPNAIDYLCHLAGLAAGMLSIGLTLQAVQTNGWKRRVLFYIFSILLGWFYLGQIEWFIGLEFFRLACVFLIAFRLNEILWVRVARFFQYALPALLIPGVFLAWRLFYFESERGATDVDRQLSDLRGEPLKFLLSFLSTLSNDVVDVLFRAWWVPLRRLSVGISEQEWMPGYGITLLILLLVWLVTREKQKSAEAESNRRSVWRGEVIWIGLGALLFGLFPVILVGRTVDFKSFSRYTMIASIGASLLWPVLICYIANSRIRNILFGFLVVSASLTHYANGFVKARDTDQINQFWWQVSWRIPQMEHRTTLLVNYPDITVEEDYFVWGPANLIYYPESMHEDYPQPGIYSLLINKETIEKILAGEKKDFSNRRSIRTYPNYGNILILTQPMRASCVQVISGDQTEYSSFEDERVTQIGLYSEVDLIFAQDAFHQPPQIPFGQEPDHNWCFYYEKATLARQLDNWNEILKLADEAFGRNIHPEDQIEWIPFLQAYAISNNLTRLREIKTELTDVSVKRQACRILGDMANLPEKTHSEINKLFCQQ
ncbi:MAG TPA: hypothetical protein VFI68_14965 [Anaerolineales bacterium]|nr:hypothetical protein [Anaerolineales bacterium]